MVHNSFRQLKMFFHVVDNTQLKAGEKKWTKCSRFTTKSPNLKHNLTVRPGPRVHLRDEDRKTDGHYIISTTQGRCAECKKNETNQFQQCKKRLHNKCFAAYHGL
ncbi:hypothetical protein MRX96_029967 [Rhipicephalus microplus]